MQKQKYNKKQLVHDEALKLFHEKANLHDININQEIFNEFNLGLNRLLKNLKPDGEVQIIGQYIYSFIQKYSHVDNKSA